ncbi:MAG TPA: hypothetical protein VL069_14135 [Opitutus sp.]|nr:hypothetical protein [Opitutus sp.]
MRALLILVLACTIFRSPAFSAQSTDPVLINGLNAWIQNGVESGLNTWYSNRPALAFEMKEKLMPVVSELGSVIDSEVIAIQPLSRRVTRFYVAVYFTRTPLWLCIERYANEETAFYLPFKFSTDPDRILPGYITEFQL